MKTKSNIILFPPLRRRWVVDRVRQLARNSFNIKWTQHALHRLNEREISSRQVISTVRRGRPAAEPGQDDYGEWTITLTKRCAGRDVRVVVSATEHDSLFIVTVM